MIFIACSSVFQLYVAVVLKNTLLKEKETELVVTDATPLLRTMAENEKIKQCFDTVRFVPVLENISFHRPLRGLIEANEINGCL